MIHLFENPLHAVCIITKLAIEKCTVAKNPEIVFEILFCAR